MDREVKFRAKRKDNNEWVYGYYIKHKTTTFCFKEDYENNTCIDIDYICFDRMTDWGLPNELVSYEVRKEEISEFTGLYDRNGKPIYEGDIILIPMRNKCYSDTAKTKERIGIVEWRKGAEPFGKDKIIRNTDEPGFNVKIIDNEDKYRYWSWSYFFDCEVIGNIYDNNDLIKEYKNECIKFV